MSFTMPPSILLDVTAQICEDASGTTNDTRAKRRSVRRSRAHVHMGLGLPWKASHVSTTTSMLYRATPDQNVSLVDVSSTSLMIPSPLSLPTAMATPIAALEAFNEKQNKMY